MPPFLAEERDYSERTAERIDDETLRLVEAAQSRVRGVLESRRDVLRRLAEDLVRRETLEREVLLALVEAPVEAAR